VEASVVSEGVDEALRRMYAEQAEDEHTYCPRCGARQWPLRGTDLMTCRRGHHEPPRLRPSQAP
jgi:hypothetical protein